MTNQSQQSLFDKYGGVPMATKMVGKLTERWLANSVLRRYLEGMSKEVLLNHQIAVVAYVMGKPVAPYDTAAMRAAHQPLNTSAFAYEDMVSLLRQVLLELNFQAADMAAIVATLDRQRHHLVAGAPPTPLYEGIDRRKQRRGVELAHSLAARYGLISIALSVPAKGKSMNVRNRFTVLLSATLVAACTNFSPDGGLNRVSELTRSRTGQAVMRDSDTNAAKQQEQVSQILAAPLTPDSAVQLALLNNKRLQAALADLGVAEADLVRAGTLRNPRFGFGRLSGNGETEIDRSVLLDLGGLLTMPLRKAIEERRFNQAQLQTALQAVRLVADTRRAYFQAVAAKQSLGYMRKVGLAAESSAELAQRMAKAGNWSKLDEAREQIFHIEIKTQIERATQNEITTRERLVRLLGLQDQQTPLNLPNRLPDLPAVLNPADQIEAKAIAQRLDVQIAKLETEATAKNLGLTRSTRFINVLEAGYENKSATGAGRADGYVVELSLPLFDWGTARTRRAESIYMRSVQRTADIAVQARSEVRETFSLYQSSFSISRQYRDEIVPLRKRISEEVLLRYNGMLASVFELLLDSRAQIMSVNAAIDAQRDFWIADTELQFVMNGGGVRATPLPTSPIVDVGGAVGAAH